VTEQKQELTTIDRLKQIVSRSKRYRSIAPIAALFVLTGVTGCSKKVSIDNSPAVATSNNFNTTKLPVLRKNIMAIYFSRYLAGANNDEQSVRQQVRYYRTHGINTLIVGVWGNGCAMYQSRVTKKLLGQSSCPNTFQDHWLDWTIDEAKKQKMQVHAYFERGIKIDSSSPIYNLAATRKWLVPGVDRTFPRMDQYVFDVEHPEVITLFKGVMTEFVKRYPTIDAVQWDDFLAYSVKLPGTDRTAKLTKFSIDLVKSTKQANPSVSFDLCHLNPDWSKRTLSADWRQWRVDRAFVQLYSEPTFKQELAYAENSAGIAITDRQLHRLPALLKNPKIKGILIFSLSGNPKMAAANLRLASVK
jgi:uncharacterized lipoprotein YddW (UPF0748 family)